MEFKEFLKILKIGCLSDKALFSTLAITKKPRQAGVCFAENGVAGY